MSQPTLSEVWAWVADALPAEARPIVGWIDATVAPPLPSPWRAVRLVFALPPDRVAGLRHWRHEAETWADEPGVHIVAIEASVAARAVLVGEPTIAGWAIGTLLDGSDAVGASIGDLARGVSPPFEAIDEWLTLARAPRL